MAHKFKITTNPSGEYAAKFVYNAEIMFWSENYKSKSSAENCIASIKKNAPQAPIVDLTKGDAGKGYRFEVAASKDGQTFVRFVAANGEPMVRTETYKSKSSAINAIKSIQKNGPDAEIDVG